MKTKRVLFDKCVSSQASPSGPTVFENQPNRKRSLWNVSETSNFLGVAEPTVRDWVYRRVIPYRKAGKNLRFDPEAIEQWTLPKSE